MCGPIGFSILTHVRHVHRILPPGAIMGVCLMNEPGHMNALSKLCSHFPTGLVDWEGHSSSSLQSVHHDVLGSDTVMVSANPSQHFSNHRYPFPSGWLIDGGEPH